MNGDRTNVPEAANHASKSAAGIWGELKHDSVGRRSIYWRTRRARGGWAFCVWRRFLPLPHRGWGRVSLQPVRDDG